MHKISNIITDTYIYISDKNISYYNYKNGIINHFLKIIWDIVYLNQQIYKNWVMLQTD